MLEPISTRIFYGGTKLLTADSVSMLRGNICPGKTNVWIYDRTREQEALCFVITVRMRRFKLTGGRGQHVPKRRYSANLISTLKFVKFNKRAQEFL